jgi:hypothetical protein
MKKITLTFLSVLFLAGGLAAQGGEQVWNFDKEKAGSLPAGFTSEKGQWKIIADSTAPSPPQALTQQAQNAGSTFNLTLISGSNYKNVDLSDIQ